ncbi:MAG: phosphoenolpyruvate carboxykinase, partial [Planctomycetes bacterium]|nr:phosphoenolpyruvate carboxykinase [Planctomycetota bacterium]
RMPTKRTRERLRVRTDLTFAERRELMDLAQRTLGFDSVYAWKANLNGIILELRTNDPRLEEFWRENWFPAPMDHTLRPHATLYVLQGVRETEKTAYYHPTTKTGILINPDSYGDLWSLTIGVAFDVAEETKDVDFLRGTLVDVNGEGLLFTGAPGLGRTSHAFLLLQTERARIHSHELVNAHQLGGQKGRISTSVCERKFYLPTRLAKIDARIQELIGKCKRDGECFILDPQWIGGPEKYIDTTRIKVVFLLEGGKGKDWIAKRLTSEEALHRLANAPEPFYNPHILVWDEERRASQLGLFRQIVQFAATYLVNSEKDVFEVQRWIRQLIATKEYSEEVHEEAGAAGTEADAPAILEQVAEEVALLRDRLNVAHPTPEQVRAMAEQYGTRTRFGNYNFVSTVKNRSAGLTVYVGGPAVQQKKLNPRQKEILRDLPKTIQAVHEYMRKAPFICVDRTMGENGDFTPKCRLYVSVHRKEMARLSHMVSQTLFPGASTPGPQETVVIIPEWQEKDRQILVFPEIGTTYVLGTDYFGEAKKGFLRMGMWFAKERGMLGLHAGAKVLRVKDGRTGHIRRHSMLIFGLTATGKTTHSCHNHGLTEAGEGVEIAQDDVVFLKPDLSALGTERGFYLKTEGVDPEIQPLIYNAVTKSEAVFENVMVDYVGNVFFGDETLTGNGRGIMQRDDFGSSKSPSVNLPPADELDGVIFAFITRRHTIVPIAARLTLEQAAAAFMLGESIETSGSDPRRAGESVREVGTNPFIIGDKAEEGNRFYEFLLAHRDKVQCYLLNTGGVGEIVDVDEDGRRSIRRKVMRVEIPEMAAIIRGIAKGTVIWEKEAYFGTEVATRVDGADMSKFDPKAFYPQEDIDRMVEQLRRERREWLAKFPNLRPEIRTALCGPDA